MNKIKLSLALLLACPSLLMAGPVDRDAALSRARSFVQQRVQNGARKAPSAASNVRLTEVVADPSFYVFNVENDGGFVMVSASDQTQSVLGYSDTGSFSLNGAPDALKSWLTQLSNVIEAIEQGTIKPASTSTRQKVAGSASITKNAIATLVPSRWNQGDPYNLQCPTYDNNGVQSLPATGCVATAMAQVMYYWRWPQDATTVIPGYTTNWNSTTTTYPDLPSTTFDWDAMTDTYDSSSSEESRQAVAELMHYVGRSVQMGYGPSSGAGAGNTVRALKNYYGYDKNAYYTSHDEYSYQDWEDLIYSELAAGRPLLMNGDTSDRTGGHEWVCDGYDGNGCYHMNWGWGGMCDGYFLLTVMFPDQQGIGGSTSSDGYSMGQGIVVGLQPGEPGQVEPDEVVRINISDLRLDRTEYTRNSERGYFRFNISYGAGTSLSNTYSFDAAFTLYDAEGNIVKETIGTESNFSITPGTWWPTRSFGVAFGPDLPDGTYYIKGRSRKNGTTEWVADKNADKNFIKAEIIDVKTLKLTIYPNVNLTVNDLELIGSGGVGSELKVRANITNNDAVEYYRDTYLLVDGQWVSGNCIVIPANSTNDYYFKYTPDTAGDHTFQLSTSKDASDAFYTVTKTVSEASVPSLSLTMSSLVPSSGGNIYGNTMRLQVRVRNNGDQPYQSYIEASPWEVQGGYYWKRSSSRQDINLAAGSDTILVYEFTDLNYGSRYNFHADSNKGGSANLGDYTFNVGILYWTADGLQHGVSMSEGLTVDTDVVAAYFPGTTVASISSGETISPNTLLYFDDESALTARQRNVLAKRGLTNFIFASAAEEITIDSDLDFHVPMAFTASKVTLTQHVDGSVGDGDYWTTIALPFVPQTVSAGGQTIDWYRSATDTGKQFDLQEFVAVDGTTLCFDHVSTPAANRPYIVCYAGTTNGESYDLRGSDVVYEATDAVFEPADMISTYSTNYKFVGTLASTTVDNAYALATDGSAFVSVGSQYALSPFAACIVANNDAAAAATRLVVAGGATTAIEAIEVESVEGQPIYNLSGVRVGTYDSAKGLRHLPAGVYIVGGKKVVR